MIRSTKLAALATLLTALGLGTGCGVCDEFCTNSDTTSGAQYQEDGLPTPRDTGSYQPADLPPAAQQPAGVYPSGN